MCKKSGVGSRQARYTTLPCTPRRVSWLNAALMSADVRGIVCRSGPPVDGGGRFRREQPAKRSKAFAAVSASEVPSSMAAEGKALPPEGVVRVYTVVSSCTMTATRSGWVVVAAFAAARPLEFGRVKMCKGTLIYPSDETTHGAATWRTEGVLSSNVGTSTGGGGVVHAAMACRYWNNAV